MKPRTKIRLSILATLIALSLVASLFVRLHIVYGESMSPTLHTWDICLMRVVRHYEPQRGDIVVFHTSDEPYEYFVKRVIALPGETIAIKRGVVLIKGQPLAEPYTTVNPDWQMDATAVPENKIFVIGDNRDVTREEVVHGLVTTRLVTSRLLWHWRWKHSHDNSIEPSTGVR